MARHILGDLLGQGELLVYSSRRIGLLWREPYTRRFLRSFLSACQQGMATLSLATIAAGSILIAGLLSLLAVNPAITAQFLVFGLLREAAPLFVALIMLVRVGMVMTTELGLMKQQGELRHLELLGVAPRDFLVIPAVFALALATVVVTFYFQILILLGVVLFSVLTTGMSAHELWTHLVMLVAPSDVLYTAVKSLLFGAMMAVVGVFSSTEIEGVSSMRLSGALARSMLQSLFLLVVVNSLVAYLVFGLLRQSVVASA